MAFKLQCYFSQLSKHNLQSAFFNLRLGFSYFKKKMMGPGEIAAFFVMKWS
jgi:hypothetical protein